MGVVESCRLDGKATVDDVVVDVYVAILIMSLNDDVTDCGTSNRIISSVVRMLELLKLLLLLLLLLLVLRFGVSKLTCCDAATDTVVVGVVSF